MTETRSSLLRRLRDPSDGDSWREFVTLYEPLLLSYVRSRGLTDEDARDVVQDILTDLLRALPRFELDRGRGRFRTWLWQITRNALADRARRLRRRGEAEAEWRRRLDPELQDSVGPEREWLTAYRQRVLEFALVRVRAQTQPRTWSCFEEHLLRHRSSNDVAAELSLTANSVYVNASRVLARVREQCADYLEELGDG